MDVPVIMLEFQQSKSYEKLEVPQIQLIVGVQDIPVVSKRQVPTVLQVQFLEVVNVPVVVQRQVRAAAVCRHVDKVVNIPVVAQRQIPMAPSVQKTMTIPLCSVMSMTLLCRSYRFLRCRLWRRQKAPTVAAH